MTHTCFDRYRTILLCLAAWLGSVVPAAADEATRPKGLAAALQPFVEQHSLAGAVVLVADREKILALEAVGFADVENKVPLRADSLFWIASQSKPITAAGLMLLVDEGKVKLDDPVENYLPEFKDIRFEGKKPGTTITVRHLLSHTSGLPFRSAQEQPTLDGLTLKDAVLSYSKTPLLYEPGTKYQYSNAGINTAGRIVEVVSGMPYETFMESRLFQPLGMKDTTFWPSEAQVQRLAKAYKPDASRKGLETIPIGQLRYPLSDRKRQPMPAGGLFSTAADVAHFCQMMLGGGVYRGKRILSESAVKEMTHRQTPATLKESYGLGWSTNGRSFGHGGALSTNMAIDPGRGLITVFLVQHAGFPGEGGKSQGAFRKAVDEAFFAARGAGLPSPVRIETGVSGHIHPALCMTRKGTLIAVYCKSEYQPYLISRSIDRGKTWSKPQLFPHTVKTPVYPGSLTPLADGRVVHAWNVWFTTVDKVKSRHVAYSISNDEGVTWSEPRSLGKATDAKLGSVIRHPIVELAPKAWLFPLMDRTIVYDPETGKEQPFGDERNHGLVPIVRTIRGTIISGKGLRSTDGGKTWQQIKPFPDVSSQGWRQQMVALGNGFLLASQSIGPGVGGDKIHFIISRDDGITWDMDHPVEFYNPGRPIGGRACPRSVEIDAQTLGTIFYDTDANQPGGSGVFFRTMPMALLAR